MNYKTILSAYYNNKAKINHCVFVRKGEKFATWFLRREEKQREEIAHLQAQVATLERIITAATEQCGHVGDSARPYMNEVKTEIPSVGYIDEYSEEAILARMKEG